LKVKTDRTEDLAFVVGLKTGDFQTLEKIYATFFPPIRGFIRHHGGNTEDAKDIFQEGIMVMYRLVQKPDFVLTSSFLSLLYPICRNIWFKSLRKRPFYEEVSEANEPSQPLEKGIEEVIAARSIDGLFRKKLSELGDQCQQLLELFFAGKPMTEISREMSLSSVSFTKKKKFQCKEKLVHLVQKDPLYPELKF
jgi:RNA polymerase sigma factor (sigma-70 family)